MEGHICRQNTLMFALVFCFELRARAARTCCHCHLQATGKNPIHDGKRGQLKLQKKVMNGTTMWSCDTELCTNGVEATKCWVFVAHFSIYSTSRCRCHTGTDIPRLCGHTLQINQVVRTVRHRISCCAPTIHWKCDAQIQNRQIKSPTALWKHLSFQCLGVIVTLNGKSASMLLEPTKNKLKQWRVIEKSVNKCHFFSQMFWIITKWMKITEKQICEDQIVTFKQSHILLYQGLLFFNAINICDRGRTITHMQIPRFHTQVWYKTTDNSKSIRRFIMIPAYQTRPLQFHPRFEKGLPFYRYAAMNFMNMSMFILFWQVRWLDSRKWFQAIKIIYIFIHAVHVSHINNMKEFENHISYNHVFLWPDHDYTRQRTGSSLVEVVAWSLN